MWKNHWTRKIENINKEINEIKNINKYNKI